MAANAVLVALASATPAQVVPIPTSPGPTAPAATTTTTKPSPLPTTAATTTPTTVVVSTTPAPPSTAPPTTPPPPITTAPETSTTVGVTTTPAPTTTEATTTTSTSTPPGPPPASLSESSVRSYLDALSRSSSNNTTALLDALRPLQDFGMSAEEAAMKGMGRFPIGGQAYYRDDFHEPRSGPPEHPHQGTDIFAAFDTPVRAPVAGVVTFADEGLGGKAAYVTEPDGTWYYMAHLNGFPADLRPGTTVSVGQLVGFTGDTGNAKGGAPHVHFEIHPRGGPAVNPKPILDGWLEEALAAAPSLLAPYRHEASRPLAAIGLARRFEKGMMSTAAPAPSPATVEIDVAADDRRLAAAIVSPLTPPNLRRTDGPPSRSRL